MKISIVIPNYNGEHLIKKNLPVLIKTLGNYKDAEIIMSDDASDDNSIQTAKDIFKHSKIKHIILENKKNSGFSTNISKGIREAGGDIIFLLNTDVIPEGNFIDPVISDFKNDDKLFGVGLMDKSIERGKVILRGRGLAKWSKGFLIHSRGEVDREDTFWISGGSSAISKKVIEKIGLFDKVYDPFYWEDIDLSYRAKKSGYKIKFNSKSIVEHRHDEGSIKKHYTESRVKSIAYRNQIIFVWMNITDTNVLLSHLYWLPYHLLSAILRLDSAFIAGFLSAVFKIPYIIHRRKNLAKIYVLKDSELLNFN